MKIPEWLKGKQLQKDALKDLRKVQLPNCTLRDVPIEYLPDEWLSLRAAADCIYGMCFYGDHKRNLQTALNIVAQAQSDLRDAEKEISAILSEEFSSGV